MRLFKTHIFWMMSQAAACDGNLYQITTEGYEHLPEPGVLPKQESRTSPYVSI